MIKKVSSEWCKMFNFKIIDPDGWDRNNFQFSWKQELITLDEFQRRLSLSTIKIKERRTLWQNYQENRQLQD